MIIIIMVVKKIDNIKIKEEKNVLFIKKGIIFMKYYIYYIIFAHILLLTGSIIFQNNIIKSKIILIIILSITGIPYFIWLGSLFIFGFSGTKWLNLFLETIEINIKSQKIMLKSMMLNVTLSFYEIENIESNFKRNDFFKSFKDLCTLTFITNDGKKYRWGFQLTQEKGKELIELIKDKMKK
ncbi:hypothetical protein [Fusobacterium polymorphum]|uniref:hypothetical protein n=1 Tax=Fusobacterium nucleatum subsp. polymorphum TaxID=76857 RepID=UPI0021C4A1A5|nr:hypothetical protein [Fusobacterium polymorphum]